MQNQPKNIPDEIAEIFTHAFYQKELPVKNIDFIGQLSISEAYEIQNLVMKQRVSQGETVVGYKVGCTSTAIQQQFGLSEPIWARVYDPHIHQQDALLDSQKYLNCAIEPEMVLKIKHDLKGFDLSDEKLIAGIDYVSPGIELHNFHFWSTPATLQELICSGGIHAGLVIGEEKVDPLTLTFSEEKFSVFKNGDHTTSATAAEIMGGPLESLRWLINSLTRKGSYLPADSVVIPGSPVELVQVKKGTELTVKIDLIGSLTVQFI